MCQNRNLEGSIGVGCSWRLQACLGTAVVGLSCNPFPGKREGVWMHVLCVGVCFEGCLPGLLGFLKHLQQHCA